MLTSLDIKKLQSVFATKEDLDRFAIKEDLNWFAIKEDLQNSEDRLGHKFLSSLDEVMHELKEIREDFITGAYRNSENSKKIENHEERISSVEESLAF
ncbi:MAG: hypothetical protein COZ34_05120 [Candidatus Pacebacteria bacterium CG_4_10_14_3_um_filter_34_15]|nr:MAG: hypothetical protein AUJ41_03300 [Candidatus Pacebacteria bacterium CG1_02_43_31]PIQ80876.1 MAG: hypothetical protein COV78_03275 [Candidatus Pacebacteria bacterium CG11_big_fil_rev_8_21_14_0_20_34_55]PIX81068.1 MAG: hypothetical protein COZ34_05120 [Candidatus Pacebacteria bacterium CG_4_10_14_3_um_filter_34_15]